MTTAADAIVIEAGAGRHVSGRTRRHWTVAAALTVALIASQLVAVPPLLDPAGGTLPSGVGLSIPPLYLLLAPLFTLWDAVALLSRSRLEGFLLGLAAGYAAWRVVRRWRRRRPLLAAAGREIALLALAIASLAAFVLGGALWHRPMAALAGVPGGLMAVDFHSHTARSRDVRGTLVGWYDLEANRRWHDRAGYDVAFVTDHNRRTIDAPSLGAAGTPVLCPGSEIGAWRAHVVMLGAAAPDDRAPYENDRAALLRLLAESRASGSPAILSIPEYERNHRDSLGALLDAGAAGLEVSNGSPKANELAGARRDTVIALARARDAAVVGVSDHHGWGATGMSWSLVSRPAGAGGAALCDAAVQAIADSGFAAVQIVERHRVEPHAWWPSLLTPVAVVWESWRAMGLPLAAAWLAWIWGVALLSAAVARRSRPTRTLAPPPVGRPVRAA